MSGLAGYRRCSPPPSRFATGGRCAFDDVGDPDGPPVVYVHGTPDSRRARHPDDGVARRAGIRVVALDRPGAGGSSPHRDGTVASFADDVAELAAHLGVGRLAVLAWSAGAVLRPSPSPPATRRW